MEACDKKQSILASNILFVGGAACCDLVWQLLLILSIENEVRKRGKCARILGIRAAVEASLGALRVVLSEIARPVERAGLVNECNDCFRTNRNKFLFFQYSRDQLTRVTVAVFHRVDQRQRDLAFFQIAEDRFAELLR